MMDVLNEHALAQPLRPSDRASFAAEGIPNRALTWSTFGELSIVARDRVVFDGGKFEFARYVRDAEGAVNAYVLPLFDECGDPIDMLAFRPGGPAAVWLGRVGIAGAEQVLMPRPDLGNELDVHEDILAWLRAGRIGITLLNNAVAAASLAGVTLRVADKVYARRLRAALTRAPRVVVRTDLVTVMPA